MTFDSLSEPVFRSYPYRDTSYDQQPMRTSQSSARTLHQFFRDHKAPVTFDRLAYKLRMKSDLQVKTLRDPDLRRRSRPRPRAQRAVPAPAPIVKSKPPEEHKEQQFRGVEGNAVHVGTLDDLIKQFHRTEIHLIHQPMEHFHSTSAYFVSRERSPILMKNSAERTIKQVQAMTEYQFPMPLSTHRTRPVPVSTAAAPQMEEYHRPSLSSPLTIPERQLTALSLSSKRSQVGREKPMCLCNKLTIVDPFNNNGNMNQQTSAGYIFPPIRPSGYFTKKTNIEESTPLPKKHRTMKKRKKTSKQSSETLDQLSIDDESFSQGLDETMKSMVSLATSEDDLINPTNTFINIQSAAAAAPVETENHDEH